MAGKYGIGVTVPGGKGESVHHHTIIIIIIIIITIIYSKHTPHSPFHYYLYLPLPQLHGHVDPLSGVSQQEAI